MYGLKNSRNVLCILTYSLILVEDTLLVFKNQKVWPDKVLIKYFVVSQRLVVANHQALIALIQKPLIYNFLNFVVVFWLRHANHFDGFFFQI